MAQKTKKRAYTHEEFIAVLRQNIQTAIDGNGCAEMYLRWWPRTGFPTVEECEDGRANEYNYTAKDVDEAFAHFDEAALLKITGIEFKYPRLQKLPDSVRRLKNLERLGLFGTGVSRLPAWLPELARLKEFHVDDVWSKRGAKIADGIAPLAHMLRLETLIWSDGWSGFLDAPKEIGALTRLKELAFSGTTMNRFPKWLLNLRSLKSFSCSGIRPKKIPGWFCDMTSLEKLWISDTEIRALPDNFGNLTALKEIRLLSNPIPFLPESFGNLVNLERLVITGLSIDYDRDLQKLPESIVNLKSLKELRLEATNVREISEALLERERAGKLKIRFEYSKRGRK
jgi:internalin A